MGRLEAKVTQHVIDNLVCKQLFDMTLLEFIATAKKRAGDNWNIIGWSDDEEAARDELSSLSLNALSNAEGMLGDALYSAANMAGKLTPYNALILASGVIKDMRVPQDKIWYDPKVDGIEVGQDD